MNICTKDTARGQYVRLCIQVPIDQPLPTTIFIRNHQQHILYEGINLIYYHCGRIGHSNESCTYTSLHSPIPTIVEQNSSTNPTTAMHTQQTPTISLDITNKHHSRSTIAEANRIVQTAVANHQLNQSCPPIANSLLQQEPKHGPWMLVQYPKNRRYKSHQFTHPKSYQTTSTLPCKPVPKLIWVKKKPSMQNKISKLPPLHPLKIKLPQYHRQISNLISNPHHHHYRQSHKMPCLSTLLPLPL